LFSTKDLVPNSAVPAAISITVAVVGMPDGTALMAARISVKLAATHTVTTVC
jgi:hypothetical protein